VLQHMRKLDRSHRANRRTISIIQSSKVAGHSICCSCGRGRGAGRVA
jgi:hypothetical protein